MTWKNLRLLFPYGFFPGWEHWTFGLPLPFCFLICLLLLSCREHWNILWSNCCSQGSMHLKKLKIIFPMYSIKWTVKAHLFYTSANTNLVQLEPEESKQFNSTRITHWKRDEKCASSGWIRLWYCWEEEEEYDKWGPHISNRGEGLQWSIRIHIRLQQGPSHLHTY